MATLRDEPEPLTDYARDVCAPGEISEVEAEIARLWNKWKEEVPW